MFFILSRGRAVDFSSAQVIVPHADQCRERKIWASPPKILRP